MTERSATTVLPSLISLICLPCTPRPITGISSIGTLLGPPLRGRSTIASGGLAPIISAAVTLPVRAVVLWVTIPPPLRPWLLYSLMAERLA